MNESNPENQWTGQSAFKTYLHFQH